MLRILKKKCKKNAKKMQKKMLKILGKIAKMLKFSESLTSRSGKTIIIITKIYCAEKYFMA